MLFANIHNLLFDFDGTLVDSSPLHDQAIRDVLAVERPDLLPDFDYEPLKGLTTVEAFRILGVHEKSQLGRCVEAKQRNYRQFVRDGRLSLVPNARLALDAARATKRHLFLVTSGSAGSVVMALSAVGLTDYFEAILTSNDVTHGKPAPDPYLFCVEKYGLTPAQTVAVEDASSGVYSAHAAGLKVIGVINSAIRPLADYFFSDLQALADTLTRCSITEISK